MLLSFKADDMTQLKVAVNASPLIYLSILERFFLLRELFSEIYIPDAVYLEVVTQGIGQPGATETQAAVEGNWIQRITVQNRVAVDALLGELDVGEAEAIVLARESKLDRILLDDHAARNKARLMGLQVSGTIGVLLSARQAGVEIDLERELDVLIQHNFRISPPLYNKIIEEQTV